MKKLLLILLLGSLIIGKVYGQDFYFDPVREATILMFTEQSKKTLNAQQRAQLVMSGMHIFMKEEIEATTDFQREFNEYLDQFNEVIQIAAEVYGIYHEVSQVAKNIKELNSIVSDTPANALAVAFSSKRNKIYTDLVMTSLDIAKDIHKVCFSGAKMTEKERIKIILGMRPKLKKTNYQLRRMAMFIKYTTFLDVWNDILDKHYFKPANRQEIILRCQQRWKGAWRGR